MSGNKFFIEYLVRQPVHIDQYDGAIRLPNGAAILSALTQEELRVNPAFASARSQDYGTLPWIHYRFLGGQVDGKDLHVGICFYDQLLVNVTLSANLYPPGKWDWSHYSLDVEAETKRFHDRWLEKQFDPPSKSSKLPKGSLSEGQATLEQPIYWKFPWGIVSSGHDFKGGGTNILVSYGDRQEKANYAYLARKVD